MTATPFAAALTALGIDPALAHDGFRAAHPLPVAVLLAMRRFRVLPTRVQTKIPCIKEWPARATTDPAKLAQWQARFNPNWSILTGRKNGVVVLDVDGEQGRADLARLESELGTLPHTPRCESGRVNGGFHIWLACPSGTDDLRNQQPIPGTKIDVRGYHGHVVVAGSLHKSGARYAWAPGCSPDETELAQCPAAWWEFLPKWGESVAPSRVRTSRTGPRVKRVHDPQSRLIGDGPDFGGFQDAISANARDYFFRAGDDAPESIIIDTLREMIADAPKGSDRDVTRYMEGNDLPRLVSRAREFVQSVRNKSGNEYNYT